MTEKVFTASVFITYEKSVLLVHHKLFDKWLPIGGKLKPGETPWFAAVRETLEETGLELDALHWPPRSMPGAPLGYLGYEEHHNHDRSRLHMNFVFTASSKTNKIQLCAEHKAFIWVTEPDVDLNMPDNVRYCLFTLL